MTSKRCFCVRLAIFALSICGILGMMLAPAAHGDNCCTPAAVYGAGFESNFVGEGTELEPYLIETAEDLKRLADWVNAGNNAAGLFFKMIRDIDISSENWIPIGFFEGNIIFFSYGYMNNMNVFSGNFDGGGHRITGLNIPASMGIQNAGLFGRVENAVFKNLTVEIKDGVGVNAYNFARARAGGIAAFGANIKIINCHVIGNISGNFSGDRAEGFITGAYAGGILGSAEGLSLSYSSFVGEVKSSSLSTNVGGLVGFIGGESSISHSHAESTVSGNDNVGGLVGFSSANISHSHAESTVSGDNNTGGLVGFSFGNISYSRAESTVSGNYNAGGLVGSSSANISHSHTESTVSGANNIGGLVGAAFGNISYSHAESTVSGNDNIGGLAGSSSANISQSHANSTVSGDDNVGGLVGAAFGNISYSNSESMVSGNDNVGGLVGSSSANISYSHANSIVSGQMSVGGLAGVHEMGSISRSFANSVVTGDNGVGGLVGSNSGSISNSYAGSAVSGGFRVGGLVGANISDANISYSYSKSTVSGDTHVGGLIGFNSGTVLFSYYDLLVSSLNDADRGTPLTTLQMQDKEFLVGFDFDTIWAIDPSINYGYPHLQGLVPGAVNGAIQVSIHNADTYRNYTVRFTAPGFERNIHVAGPLVSLSGLDRAKVYKVELLSPIGVVFGTVENIDLSENSVARITFDSLPLPRSVRMSLFGESGAIHSGFTINWYEGTRLLGEGSRLDGLRAGMPVRYEITLGSPLNSIYARPEGNVITISENDNANFVAINLVSLQSQLTTVTGSVQSGGYAVAGAMVILRSRPGVYPPFEIVVFTDANGRFEADVLPGNFIVEVVRFGFINRRWNLRWDDDVVDGTIPNIELEQAEGLIVQLAMEYTEASAPGEIPSVWPLLNTRNIDLTVRNVTQNRELSDVSLSGIALVLPDSTINENDEIRITAVDTTGNMLNAEVSFIARDHAAGVTLAFTQRGFWQAREFSSASSVMALVYDEAGRYIATYNPAGHNITGSVLPAGQYTVVFIGRSQLLRHLANLSDLAALGLSEGRDYVRRNITITDGVISVISNLSIPALDETKLHYTDPLRTSLTANRLDVSAGTLVTMRAEFAFLPEHTGRISGSTIVIRIPGDSELIPNSVTVDGRASDYRRTPTGFEVRVSDTSGIVRFMAVPQTGGSHAFNAFIRFDYQGNTLLQPVGAAVVRAEPLTISAPARTALRTITVRGTAVPNYQVRVFANDIQVGTTTSNAVGSWQLTFELQEPSTFSFHYIHAEATRDLGVIVRSEAVRTVFNITHPELSRITLYYSWGQGWWGNLRTYHGRIGFDFLNPAAVPPFYTWHPWFPNYTFVVELANDTPEVLADALNVYVVTRNLHGGNTRIRTTFDRSRGAWVGTHNFIDFTTLPVEVSAEIVEGGAGGFVIDAEMLNEFHEMVNMPDPDIERELDELDFTEADLAFIARLAAMPQEQATAEIEAGFQRIERDLNRLQADIDGFLAEWKAMADAKISELGVGFTIGDASGFNRSNMIADGFEASSTSDGSYIYSKITDEKVVIVDFTRNRSQITTLGNASSLVNLQPLASTDDLLGAFNRLIDEMQRIRKLGRQYFSFVDLAATFFDHNTAPLKERLSNLKRDFRNYSQALGRHSSARNFILERFRSIRGQLQGFGIARTALARASGVASRLFDFATLNVEYRRFRGVFDALNNCCHGTCFRSFPMHRLNLYLAMGGSAAYFASSRLAGWAANMAATAFSFTGAPLFTALATTEATSRGDYRVGNHNRRVEAAILEAIRICREECGEEPFNPDGSPSPGLPVIPIIDPSGYIYEAVPSNRLPGVTVSVYSQADGFWGAARFDQQNPLITDGAGQYAWDVPVGYWQVRAVKAGFEPTQSAWLPVPPPQFDVNLGMISRAAPYVVYASGFENFIEIAFSRFMIPDTLTTDSITLTGAVPSGGYEIAWVDAEEDYNIEPVRTFVRTIRILPRNGTFPMGETVGVSISTSAQSYADVALASAFHSYVDIKMEPKLLENQGQINLRQGETQTISVTVLPVGSGANRRIRAFSSSPIFVTVDEEAMTNTNGTATFRVSGELSGVADILFTLDGTQVRGASRVTVALPGEPAQTTTRYRAVTVTPNAGGIARADRVLATKGETITVTLTPHSGHELVNIFAADESGATVNLYGSENTRAFTMPASAVAITVLFEEGVREVRLNRDTMYLTSGASETLIATIAPENAVNNSVTWSLTGDGTIATVDQDGKVIANSAGRAGSVIVTATAANGLSASCVVTVLPVSVTGVTLNSSGMTIAAGRQAQFIATITPLNATNRNVIWSTSNASVAAVNNGVISAHAEGSATITVTTLDGNKTAHGTVTVTVTNNNMGGSEDRQAYFENRFPGRNVIILPDGGALGIANGNTVIVGGAGNDWIEMSGGENIFIYEIDGGHDVIRSVNTERNANELHFGPGITRDDLSFFKKGNDLYIAIAGEETGSVTIVNWYVAEQYRLRVFLHDGTELSLTYMISASPLASFGSLQMAYVQPEAQTVTITNTGLASITLTQPTAINFDIGELSTTTLAASGDIATFTIRPKANLSIGVYDETITISGCNEASATVNVSFKVTRVSGRNMTSGTGRGGCNAIGFVLSAWLMLLLFLLKKK